MCEPLVVQSIVCSSQNGRTTIQLRVTVKSRSCIENIENDKNDFIIVSMSICIFYIIFAMVCSCPIRQRDWYDFSLFLIVYSRVVPKQEEKIVRLYDPLRGP